MSGRKTTNKPTKKASKRVQDDLSDVSDSELEKEVRNAIVQDEHDSDSGDSHSESGSESSEEEKPKVVKKNAKPPVKKQVVEDDSDDGESSEEEKPKKTVKKDTKPVSKKSVPKTKTVEKVVKNKAVKETVKSKQEVKPLDKDAKWADAFNAEETSVADDESDDENNDNNDNEQYEDNHDEDQEDHDKHEQDEITHTLLAEISKKGPEKLTSKPPQYKYEKPKSIALDFSYVEYEKLSSPVCETSSNDLLKTLVARAYRENKSELKRVLETILKALNFECQLPFVDSYRQRFDNKPNKYNDKYNDKYTGKSNGYQDKRDSGYKSKNKYDKYGNGDKGGKGDGTK